MVFEPLSITIVGEAKSIGKEEGSEGASLFLLLFKYFEMKDRKENILEIKILLT